MAEPVKITTEEYRELVAPRKRSKYRNERVKHSSGRTFDSKAEAARYDALRFMESRGMISDLECQPVYVLQEKPRIIFKLDFRYTERGKIVCEDVKGMAVTRAFSIKRRLFEANYPDIELRIIRKRKKK